MASRKKAAAPLAPNPLLEAFQDYAVNMARFTEARAAAFTAQRALKESADRLATFGIFVSTTPRPNTTEPALPDEGDSPPTLHAEAPTVARTPSATEVAAIRSEAYGSEQEDTEALAGDARDVMGRLMSGLGGSPSAGPQLVGHPMEAPTEAPDAPNRTRGPVEQKPVE